MPNLAGTYSCNGFDSHDGPFSGSRLILTLDEKNSDFQHGYTAYGFTGFSAEGDVVYNGAIVANGNTFAMNFKNITPEGESDHGVALGTITHDRDDKGISQTVLHNFYYQPEYKGSGHGVATCIKES